MANSLTIKRHFFRVKKVSALKGQLKTHLLGVKHQFYKYYGFVSCTSMAPFVSLTQKVFLETLAIFPFEAGRIMVSILQMGKIMHREVKWPAQGNTPSQLQSQDLNPLVKTLFYHPPLCSPLPCPSSQAGERTHEF